MTPVPRRLPHVVQIGFYCDPEARLPSQLLDAWATLVDVAEAASHSGIRVSVVQACSYSQQLIRNGVHYYFLPLSDASTPNLENSAFWALLHRLAPDVFHVHGLHFHRQVLSLAALRPRVPIILQDHASRPPRIWRRKAWRRGLSVTAGIAFCALEQAQPFVKAGLLCPTTGVYEIPESTSRFTPGERDQARRLTGVEGNPAVLWVGHLDANKDPLTVLAGVSAAVRWLPSLQLYCCFASAPLLRAVQDRISTDPNLCDRVHLLGQVTHERIELLMRAADIFVLGSHREGSGYSLIEALACGLAPVVTDIPSFRSLTRAGAVGRLWPCEDQHAMCEALQSIASRVGPEMRAVVRAHFDRELSFHVLGLKLAAMYEDVLTCTSGITLAPRREDRQTASSP